MTHPIEKPRRSSRARLLFINMAVLALGVVTMALLSSDVVAQTEEPAQEVTDDFFLDVPDAPIAEAVVTTTGEKIPYQVIDGMAILEGDIVLGTHNEVQANGIKPLEFVPITNPTCESFTCSTINTGRSWPGGIVPFTFGPNTPASGRASVLAGIADWESKTSVRFIERTTETAYIEFLSTGAGNVCSSSLGRTGGRQFIRYSGSGAGCMSHEIGHAMGLNHEQNRNDRDEHVIIDLSNTSAPSQFRKATTSTDVGPYDFGSMMHYGPTTFAIDRSRPVIIPLDPSVTRVGGVTFLSPIDVLGVEFVYGSAPTPPTPTPTPVPAGAAPTASFVGLTNGGTIPAVTEYGDVRVGAFDTDIGGNDGDGIATVEVVVRLNGAVVATAIERASLYEYGFTLLPGQTYTLTLTATSTAAAGGTSTTSTITVTAQGAQPTPTPVPPAPTPTPTPVPPAPTPTPVPPAPPTLVGQSITLQSQVTGRFIDIDRDGSVDQSVTARVDDIWNVLDAGDGYVFLQNDLTGRYLDSDGANADVDTSKVRNADDRWQFVTTANGVRVQNVNSGSFLTGLGFADAYNVVSRSSATSRANWTVSVVNAN